jgi:hypothetical protein
VIRYALLLAVLVTAACSSVPLVTTRLAPLRTVPVAAGPGRDASRDFAQLFCDTLAHNPDAGAWGLCSRYFQPTAFPREVMPFVSPYRVLIVSGIFGQCIEPTVRPFQDAADHLQTHHGARLEYVSVDATGSSAHNAAQIAAYLERQFAGADRRPYIAIGYSKGASDILESFRLPELAHQVVAVITIAGTILGTRALEVIPHGVLELVPTLGPCKLADRRGLDDLRRSVRVAAMTTLRVPAAVRLYAIAAVSTPATTSSVLRSGYQALSAYSLDQDSQMIHEDTIAPTAAYLGTAKGDHWAVALPFEQTPFAALVDQNHYPRAALIEAALRFVVADLSGS